MKLNSIHTAALILLLASACSFAQQQSSMARFRSLADSAARVLAQNLRPGSAVTLGYAGPAEYAVFREWVAAGLLSRGITVSDTSAPRAVLTIEQAAVLYGDVYKQGIFSAWYTPRTVLLKGEFLMDQYAAGFSCAVQDTVPAGSVQQLESSAYPFTRAVLPAEPFWGSLAEPVVVLGAAAVTVYLFFTVRSK